MSNFVSAAALLPVLLALSAGASFGTWPIPTAASHVPAGATTFVMAFITVLMMVPVIRWQGGWPVATPKAWGLVATGGVIQTVGIISMVMLAALTFGSGKFPDFFVIALVAQVCVAAVLKWMQGGFTTRHAVGFAAAAVVAIAMGKID